MLAMLGDCPKHDLILAEHNVFVSLHLYCACHQYSDVDKVNSRLLDSVPYAQHQIAPVQYWYLTLQTYIII